VVAGVGRRLRLCGRHAPVGADQDTGAASAVVGARSEALASPSAHACPTPPDLRPVALAHGLVECWRRDSGTGRNPSPAAPGSTTVTVLGAISLSGRLSWSSSSPPPLVLSGESPNLSIGLQRRPWRRFPS
jgi:hypothetical protein